MFFSGHAAKPSSAGLPDFGRPPSREAVVRIVRDELANSSVRRETPPVAATAAAAAAAAASAAAAIAALPRPLRPTSVSRPFPAASVHAGWSGRGMASSGVAGKRSAVKPAPTPAIMRTQNDASAHLEVVYRKEREMHELGEAHFLELGDALAAADSELAQIRAEAKELEGRVECEKEEACRVSVEIKVQEALADARRHVVGGIDHAKQDLEKALDVESRLLSKLKEAREDRASHAIRHTSEIEDAWLQCDEAQRETIAVQRAQVEMAASHQVARGSSPRRSVVDRNSAAAAELRDCEANAAARSQQLLILRGEHGALELQLQTIQARCNESESEANQIFAHLALAESACASSLGELVESEKDHYRNCCAMQERHEESMEALEADLGVQLRVLNEALSSAECGARSRAEREAASFASRLLAMEEEGEARLDGVHEKLIHASAEACADRTRDLQSVELQLREVADASQQHRQEMVQLELSSAKEHATLRVEVEVHKAEADRCGRDAAGLTSQLESLEVMVPQLRREFIRLQGERRDLREMLPQCVVVEREMQQHALDLEPELEQSEAESRALNDELEVYRQRAPEVARRSAIATGRLQALEQETSKLRESLRERDESLGKWRKHTDLTQRGGDVERRAHDEESEGFRRAVKLQQKSNDDLKRQGDVLKGEVDRLRSEVEKLYVPQRATLRGELELLGGAAPVPQFHSLESVTGALPAPRALSSDFGQECPSLPLGCLGRRGHCDDGGLGSPPSQVGRRRAVSFDLPAQSFSAEAFLPRSGDGSSSSTAATAAAMVAAAAADSGPPLGLNGVGGAHNGLSALSRWSEGTNRGVAAGSDARILALRRRLEEAKRLSEPASSQALVQSAPLSPSRGREGSGAASQSPPPRRIRKVGAPPRPGDSGVAGPADAILAAQAQRLACEARHLAA